MTKYRINIELQNHIKNHNPKQIFRKIWEIIEKNFYSDVMGFIIKQFNYSYTINERKIYRYKKDCWKLIFIIEYNEDINIVFRKIHKKIPLEYPELATSYNILTNKEDDLRILLYVKAMMHEKEEDIHNFLDQEIEEKIGELKR